MIDWLNKADNEIINGLGDDGKRLLPKFCEDYFSIFNIRITHDVGCGRCIAKYINELKKYLKMKETELTECKTVLRLKDGYSPYVIMGMEVRNETLTNEEVLFFLENHPIAGIYFEGFSDKFKGDKGKTAIEQAIDAVKEAIAAEKTDIKQDIKEKKTTK